MGGKKYYSAGHEKKGRTEKIVVDIDSKALIESLGISSERFNPDRMCLSFAEKLRKRSKEPNAEVMDFDGSGYRGFCVRNPVAGEYPGVLPKAVYVGGAVRVVMPSTFVSSDRSLGIASALGVKKKYITRKV